MDDMLIYEEKQTLQLWWVWVVVLGLTVGIWYSAYVQLILHIPVGTNPASDIMIAVFWVFYGILLPLFIFTTDMRISVTSNYIRIRSANRLVFNRAIPRDQILQAYVHTYNPLRDYGGWGNRGFRKNKAYTLGGNKGVMMILASDQKVLIGTPKPEELLQAVQSILSV